MSQSESPSPDHTVCLDGWEPIHAEGDLFCRMCGVRLLDYRITPEPLFFVGDDHELPVPVTLTFDNAASLRPLAVQLYPADQSLRVEQGSEILRIPAGSRRDLTVRWEPSVASALEAQSTLTVIVVGSGLSHVIPVLVGAYPTFAHTLEPLPPMKVGASARSAGLLRHVGGVPATVTAVTFSHPGLTQSGLVGGDTLKKGDERPFAVTCQSGALTAGHHQAVLRLELAPRASYELPIDIDVLRKAKLSFHFSNLQVAAGLYKDVMLTLQNDGDVPETLSALALPDHHPWFHAALPRLPLELAPRTPVKIRCRIDATGLSIGAYELTIAGRLADDAVTERTVTVRVKTLEDYAHFVAIDFGTSNSCVSFYDDRGAATGRFRMVTFDTGAIDDNGDPVRSEIVPSVVFYDERTDQWFVGFEALRRAQEANRQDALLYSVKRLLNKSKIYGHQREIDVAGVPTPPERVAAEVFRFLKRETERQLGYAIKQVMLTVPANFTDVGIQAVFQAARDAGLDPFQIDQQDEWHMYRIDEPTAAALDSATHELTPGELERSVLVFDFGGGTLDVSILIISATEEKHNVLILAHKGANWLGGDDFTSALVRFIADSAQAGRTRVLRYDVRGLQNSGLWNELDSETEQREILRNHLSLWQAAEEAKIKLSNHDAWPISVTLSTDDTPFAFQMTITRAEFEARIVPLVDDALKVVDRAIQRAGKTRRGFALSSLNEVIATGSASLVPYVRARLEAHVGQAIAVPYEGFSPKACVARGACSYATYSFGTVVEKPIELIGLHDVTNCSYGYGSSVGMGTGARIIFRELIEEGTEFAKAVRPSWGQAIDKLGRTGSATIRLYQHTGNPTNEAERYVEGNPDVTLIDLIQVARVHVPNPGTPPAVQVRMWIAQDGLLDADAQVEGHAVVFSLQNRTRPWEGSS